MSIWPPAPSRPLMPMISSLSAAMSGVSLAAVASPAPSSTGNPFTTMAFFEPLYLAEAVVVDKVWWYSGTAVAGTGEIGIYSGDLQRLFTTGTVTTVGASKVQEVNITDLRLDAGTYYLALGIDNATASYLITNAPSDRIGQFAVQSYYIGNVTPLPASVTVFDGSTRQVPVFGMSLRPLVA